MYQVECVDKEVDNCRIDLCVDKAVDNCRIDLERNDSLEQTNNIDVLEKSTVDSSSRKTTNRSSMVIKLFIFSLIIYCDYIILSIEFMVFVIVLVYVYFLF